MDNGAEQGSHQPETSRPPGGAIPSQVPPRPAHAPAAALPPLAKWLRMPRPEAGPGIWRCGYRPRAQRRDTDEQPMRRLVASALASGLAGWFLIALLWNNYLGPYWMWPLAVLTPDSWRGSVAFVVAAWVYYFAVFGGIAIGAGRVGHWPELGRRILRALHREDVRQDVGDGAEAPRTPKPDNDPARWPELRARGAHELADRLTDELGNGRMTDVDHARITHAIRTANSRTQGLDDVAEDVRARGAAAFLHGSGARDLPARTARHDLSQQQVKIGVAVDSDRNPDPYRGAGIALDPQTLGTSALAVGPHTVTTDRVVRPVLESACLQALAGQTAVVAVTTNGERLAPDEQFDIVLTTAADGVHSLDLYGGTTSPDDAAATLAEALIGDIAAHAGSDSRRAATVLGQLLGPYRAAHGRFPDVPELRELLDDADALAELRGELQHRDLRSHIRDLDAHGRAGDVAGELAERVALLDRPALAGILTTPETTAGRRPFSLRSLTHPVRVRVDLPERGHAEASRILARLVLAQFIECAVDRPEDAPFALLVLDDGDRTVTPQALRGLQRLQTGSAGVLMTLRTLDDVPAHLRNSALGAAGCRIACSGVSPQDAVHFADVWGTAWVETRDVTNRELTSDEPLTKAAYRLRRYATGRYASAESVTVRKEQRQRWSASELANELPAGHAVLSFSTVRGDRTLPILTDLGDGATGPAAPGRGPR